MWGIGVTWAIGAGVAIAGWLWITIASEPNAKRDVLEMVDSARIAGEKDYRKSGFIAE